MVLNFILKYFKDLNEFIGRMEKQYNTYLRLLFITSLFLACIGVNANTITSNAGVGNWGTGASWVGGIAPGAGDNAIIAAGSIITINVPANCINLTINAAGQLKCTTVQTLTITGNFINNGTCNLASGTFLFAGSTNQVIRGSTPPSFNNLTENLAAINDTLVLDTAITIGGNYTITLGVFNCQSNQITGNGGGTMSMAAGNTLLIGNPNVATAITFPTAFTTAHITLSATSNVIYRANANQTISGAPKYANLEITSGSASTTSMLVNNTTVAGNLLIQNGTGTVTLFANTFTLNVAGNYTDNGVFTGGTGTVNFNGSGVQILTFAAGGENFYNLTFNNSSAASPNITVSQNINVANNSTFTQGNLDLQGHNYIITGGATATNDNFNGGAILTSIAGSNFNVTDVNSNKLIKFWGTAIGTATNGITFNVTAGRIQFDNFTEYGTANFTKTLNTDDVFGGGNFYHGPVTFTATASASRWRMGDGPTIADTFYNATFNALANSGSNNNFIVGANSIGNAFYGTTNMTSVTPGGFYVCRDNGNGNASCTFYGPVIANIGFTGNMTFADAGSGNVNTVTFDSTITLNSTPTSTGFYHFADNNIYGTVTLNPGGQFLAGSVSGQTDVFLCNVTQYGNKPQTINTTGSSGAQYIGGVSALPAFKCIFNGPCTFTADTAGYFFGSTFNGVTNINVNHANANGYIVSDSFNAALTATVGDIEFQNNIFGGTTLLQHTSSFASKNNGGNTFNGPATIINFGTDTMETGAIAPDSYENSITFTQNGGAGCVIYPAYANTSNFGGNIIVDGTNPAQMHFGAHGGGMNINSSGSIVFSIAGSATVPTISNLSMGMTLPGTNVLQFNFSPPVTNSLGFVTGNTGVINLNGNTLTLGTSALSPGTLNYPAPPAIAGWIYGGSLARWVGTVVTIPLPTSVSVATTGFFPLGSTVTQGDFEPFWFSTSGVTGLGNIITVSQPSTATALTLITQYTDATWNSGTPVGAISNAAWNLSTGVTTLGAGVTAQIMFGGFGFQAFAFPYNTNASNATNAVANYATPSQLYTSTDDEVERTGLSLAQISANPTWYIGVSIPPAPVAGGSTFVCSDSTIQLTASSITGATYNWTGPNGFTSNVQNPTITNATTAYSGTYSVTATVGTITGPAGTITVTVNPVAAAPIASSNTPLCAGDTLKLFSSNVGGATYSWKGPNSFKSSTQDTIIAHVTVPASGTYSVITITSGCPSAVGTTTVLVNPVPASPVATNNTPICSGSTLNLFASTIAGVTYSWAGPNGFTSFAQDTSILNASAIASGTYSVTATAAGCSSAPGTTVVTVNPTPAAPTATSNAPICSGSTLDLFASSIPSASYSWTGPNGFSSPLQNPTISGATGIDAGTYSVTATLGTCTGPAGTVGVVIGAAPVAPTPGSNSPVCAGSALNLTATSVAGATYSWTGPNGFNSALQNPTISNVTVADAGSYTVTDTVSGCTASAPISVTVNPSPSVSINPPQDTICNGSSKILNAIGASGYVWSPATGLSCTNCASPTASPSITTPYQVVVSNGFGCTDTAKINLVVNPKPVIGLISVPANDSICSGDSAHITGSGGTGYVWMPGSFTSNNIWVKPTSNATYSLAVTNNGCTSDTTISIAVSSHLNVSITRSDTICIGDSITLTATGGGGYKWSNNSTNSSIRVSPGSLTTYSVIVSKGCIDTAHTTISVDVPTLKVCCADTVKLNDTVQLHASGATSYAWNPSTGLTCYNCADPIASPSVTTTYTISSTDAAGCPANKDLTVYVVTPCADFQVPTVFTPNNDGINDDFVINVVDASSYSLTIFDRWGRQVFTSSSSTLYWNGRINGSENLVPDGTYYYSIKASCGNNEYDKKGFVEVLGEK